MERVLWSEMQQAEHPGPNAAMGAGHRGYLERVRTFPSVLLCILFLLYKL